MELFLGKYVYMKKAGGWVLSFFIFLFLILLAAFLSGLLDTALGAETFAVQWPQAHNSLRLSSRDIPDLPGEKDNYNPGRLSSRDIPDLPAVKDKYDPRTLSKCNYCHEKGGGIKPAAGSINAATEKTADPNGPKNLPGGFTGTFEFGAGKNSATELESMNMAMEMKNKIAAITFLLNSQQKEEKIEALHIEADFQGNLIFTQNLFGFGSFGYLRDLSWYDDFIRIGAGLGYMGIKNLKIQSGVHWAMINRGNVYDRKTLSKTTIDFTLPLGAGFSFRQITDFEWNLGEIHGLDSFLNDYSTRWDAAVTADITETIFLAARYRWRYLDNPITASGDQREYGLTLGARL